MLYEVITLAEGTESEKEFKMLRKSHRNEWVASHLSDASSKVFRNNFV